MAASGFDPAFERGVLSQQKTSVRSWTLIAIVLAANVLNLLDRQLLAATAPSLKRYFQLTNVGYGEIVSSFSLLYAVATPLSGLLIDRIGLRAGPSFAVAFWSLAGISTGLARTFRGLLLSRAALGFGEAASLPFASKATASFLPAAEWGFANAFGSIAVTAGSVLAPLLAGRATGIDGWRGVFIGCGCLGLLWVGIWWLAAGRTVSPAVPQATATSPARLLRDSRMWMIVAAYPLVMSVFSLWINWTTVYLVQVHGLGQNEANSRLAWAPPVFMTLGGFFNGVVTYRRIRSGISPVRARVQICWLVAPLFLASAALPLVRGATLATCCIGVSLFACQSVVSSLNLLPLDLFGAERAGFSISLLAAAYALMQMFVSPLIGAAIDRSGFSSVCIIATVLPLLGVALGCRVRQRAVVASGILG